MPRQSKPVLISNQEQHVTTDVLGLDTSYQVTYKGDWISVRKTYERDDSTHFVNYERCNFSTKGHAQAMATKLNQLFDTEHFQVREVALGEVL